MHHKNRFELIYKDPLTSISIPLPKVALEIIHHPSMQRLSKVSVGGTYTGRTNLCLNTKTNPIEHNRLAHQIRVFGLLLKTLPEHHHEAIYSGLVHDRGHGPYSHDLERAFNTGGGIHETMGRIKLNDNFGAIFKKYGLNILQINQLVSGAIKSPLKGNKSTLTQTGIFLGADHLDSHIVDSLAHYDPIFQANHTPTEIFNSLVAISKTGTNPEKAEIHDLCLATKSEIIKTLIDLQVQQHNIIFSPKAIAIQQFSKYLFLYLHDQNLIDLSTFNLNEIEFDNHINNARSSNPLLSEMLDFLFQKLQNSEQSTFWQTTKISNDPHSNGKNQFCLTRTYDYAPTELESGQPITMLTTCGDRRLEQTAHYATTQLSTIFTKKGIYQVTFAPPKEMRHLTKYLDEQQLLKTK